MRDDNKSLLVGLLVGLLVNWLTPAVLAQAYYPIYWVGGSVQAAGDITVDGRQVVLYESEEKRLAGYFVSDTVGAGGASGQPGQFLINAFAAEEPFAGIGLKYFVAIPRGSDGYGAAPVEVALSGNGVDIVPTPLVLAYATGPVETGAQPPAISDVRFGTRLYQRTLVEKGEKFIVSETPKISAKIESATPLDVNSFRISASSKSGAASPQTYLLGAADVTAKAAAGEPARSVSVSYDIPPETKLPEGDNEVAITAANAFAATTETLAVTVMGGPLQVIGPVLAFPAPFSVTKHGTATIQYQLSRDGEIELNLLSAAGRTIKSFAFQAGEEGGAAGYNKVSWNGVTNLGLKAGNAVYVGIVVARREGRTLARFKLSVVD